MASIFTSFIRALDSENSPPERDEFEAVWSSLRRALISKLKRKSLWSASPTYLGVYGWSSWSEKEALEELLADCYQFIFVDRQRGLRAELKVKENIEGLVFRNISNFLYDLQKRHDPLGFRAFVTLQTAIRQAVRGQTLYVLRGNPAIGNNTILGFTQRADADSAEVTELSAQVRAWNDQLLPDLITANGSARRAMQARLADRVCDLREQGVEAFRFKQIVDALKADVRERWSMIWDQEQGDRAIDTDGGLASLVLSTRPDTELEDRDAFQALLTNVGESIHRLEVPEKTRSYLHRLWWFLSCHAADSLPDDMAMTTDRSDGRLPSHRKISRLLGIPRDRFTELFATLGRLIEECRAANSKKTQVSY